MSEQAAKAARVGASARPKTDWSFTDEETLVRGMIADEDFAWLEFLRRFDSHLTERIKMRMSRFHPTLCSTDSIQEIKGDIHHSLRHRDNMRPLRGFDSRHGTMSAWLCRIADHATMRRLLDLTSLDDQG